MREKYFCPNCRAVITCGDRFCGNCGTALRWVIPQSLGPEAPSDNPVTTGARQLQKSGMPSEGDTSGGKEKASSVGTMTSLSNDIARLLAGFEKQIKDQPN